MREKNDRTSLNTDTDLVEAFDQRPHGHSHSLGLILVFLRMSLSAIGFRPAARALEILAPVLPHGQFPSANGGQSWLLRVGLHELSRPKEQADDWVWMIDHTIQTGHGKCLIVVGIRLSAWEHKRAEMLAEDADAPVTLCHQDLSVWALERVESSTGEKVFEQLKELSRETGVTPCCLLTDQGADVRKGAELFCQQNPQTSFVHDIAHATANAVKRQLNHAPQWESFLADANKSKTALRQTPYAFLIPPELKSKARWMNIDRLIAWSRRVQAFLLDPTAGLEKAEVPTDPEKLREKMAWLDKHREPLAVWSTMLELVALILVYIRTHGYHRDAVKDLTERLSSYQEGPARAVATEVLEFVGRQSETAGDGRRIGSSEVIESLIGAGKQLQGRQKSGYTKMVLGMAAKVVHLSGEVVRAALAAVKVSDVASWVRKKVGLSLQAKRQRALPTQLCGTKTG